MGVATCAFEPNKTEHSDTEPEASSLLAKAHSLVSVFFLSPLTSSLSGLVFESERYRYSLALKLRSMRPQ